MPSRAGFGPLGQRPQGGLSPQGEFTPRRRIKRRMVSLLGVVDMKRRLWRCSACGLTHGALEGRLGMQGTLSGGAAEAGLLLLAEMPHRRAGDLLARLCAVRIGASTVQRLADKVGPAARRSLARDQARLLAPVSADRPAPQCEAAPSDTVVRQADAVKVRFDDGWRDVKVGVSYGLGPREGDGQRRRVVEPQYCALLGEAQEVGRQIQALSLGQGLRRSQGSQFISDGGNWMAGLAEGILSWSEWTVDYYHVSRQVAAALAALHGEGTERTLREHKRLSRVLLKKAGNAKVRRSLAAQGRRKALEEDQRHKARNVSSYLERFERQTRYSELRRRALPIGSGCIEGGGCKLYVQQRFKGPGMRWSQEGFAKVEAIRRHVYNNRHERLRALLYSHSTN